jgi:dihydrofolate reductase
VASIFLVAAIGRNRVIGREGQLPWRLPDDLKHFKALTLGKPVVMGRKTFDSVGKPLPGRLNVVMSRSPRAIEGCIVVPGAQEALAACGDVPEIAIIGGGTIYEAFLDRADRLELTLVDAAPEGDAHFPAYEDRFREVSRREHPVDERHAVPFALTTWAPIAR